MPVSPDTCGRGPIRRRLIKVKSLHVIYFRQFDRLMGLWIINEFIVLLDELTLTWWIFWVNNQTTLLLNSAFVWNNEARRSRELLPNYNILHLHNTSHHSQHHLIIVIIHSICFLNSEWLKAHALLRRSKINPGGGGGTLGISGWGCAARTLEPSTYTRASSAELCYPMLE